MSLIAGITGRGRRAEAERRRGGRGMAYRPATLYLSIYPLKCIWRIQFKLPLPLPSLRPSLRPLQAAGQCPPSAPVPRASVGPHAGVPPRSLCSRKGHTWEPPGATVLRLSQCKQLHCSCPQRVGGADSEKLLGNGRGWVGVRGGINSSKMFSISAMQPTFSPSPSPLHHLPPSPPHTHSSTYNSTITHQSPQPKMKLLLAPHLPLWRLFSD